MAVFLVPKNDSTYLKIYSLLMCKSSELKKFNEYFNVLIFGSLDLKNIDLEMAIRQA